MGKRTNTAKWDEKTNRWKINVQKDGKRKSFYSSTPGRTGQREANTKADAWLDEGIEKTNTKVEILFENGYLADIKARTSQSHWRPEESRWETWIKPQIGIIRIDRITEQHLQNIINAAYQGGLSKKSLENLRATLVAFMKYCRKCKVTTLFPESITIPKSAAVKEKKILQPEHIIILFTSDKTKTGEKTIYDEFIHAYRFQAVTGLRPGEILGLKWDDIKGDTVTIQRSINVYNETTSGKNDNAKRSFYLNDTSRSILAAQQQEQDGPYVFPRITENGYWRRLKRYCKSNRIPEVSPYEMRHTFVSIIQELSEAEIKTLAGHSKSMDTFGVYAHAVNGTGEKTAQSIHNIFNDILNPQK